MPRELALGRRPAPRPTAFAAPWRRERIVDPPPRGHRASPSSTGIDESSGSRSEAVDRWSSDRSRFRDPFLSSNGMQTGGERQFVGCRSVRHMSVLAGRTRLVTPISRFCDAALARGRDDDSSAPAACGPFSGVGVKSPSRSRSRAPRLLPGRSAPVLRLGHDELSRSVPADDQHVSVSLFRPRVCVVQANAARRGGDFGSSRLGR